MGSLLSKPKTPPPIKLPPIEPAPPPPTPTPPAPMPIPDDSEVALANKRAAAQRISKSGRQATMLSLNDAGGAGGGTFG